MWDKLVIHSELLNEDVVIVRTKKGLDEARAEHPTLICYSKFEIEKMVDMREDEVQLVHAVKHILGGHEGEPSTARIVPDMIDHKEPEALS